MRQVWNPYLPCDTVMHSGGGDIQIRPGIIKPPPAPEESLNQAIERADKLHPSRRPLLVDGHRDRCRSPDADRPLERTKSVDGAPRPVAATASSSR